MNNRIVYQEEIRASNERFFDALPDKEQKERTRGSFFTCFEAICAIDRDVPITASHFPNIRRSQTQGSQIFPTTADESLLEICDEATSLQSDTTNTNQLTTSVDFLYNEEGERAHLFSNAPVCHAAYFMIVQAACGVFSKDYEKRRKLLNGMKGRRNRMKDSGVKHSKYNKFHLFLQKQLLDCTPPALIIVPLMPLSEIQQWDGTTSYGAMVLPCGQRAIYAARMTLPYVRSVCTPMEIQTGIQVLSSFVTDIAESLLDEDNDVLQDFNMTAENTRDPSAVRWKELVKHLRSHDSPSYPVPALKNLATWQNVKVAKGTFDKDASCLPDPFLLAAKAAINYSSLVGRKLMPACRTVSSGDSSDDSST